MKKIIIKKEIFEMFPDFKRGVLISENINNAEPNDKIKELLNKEIKSKEGFSSHPYIEAWEEAHRKFGSNPNKYPPSVKSLIKRVSKGKSIPFINNLVALFNYISLKYIIPCGGDDLDKISGNLVLGFSSGDEKFIPLGGNEVENPLPGEVIYFDDNTKDVMCRKWNWRNGDFSKMTENTKRAVINIDGIGKIPEDTIKKAGEEMKSILETELKANVKFVILKKEAPEQEI